MGHFSELLFCQVFSFSFVMKLNTIILWLNFSLAPLRVYACFSYDCYNRSYGL